MENRKVNILGTEYKIIYGNCKEIPELKEMDGYTDSSTHEIVVDDMSMSDGEVGSKKDLASYRKSVVRHEIKKCEEKGIRDWSTIKTTTRENLRDYIFAKTKRNPMIIPIIMEV